LKLRFSSVLDATGFASVFAAPGTALAEPVAPKPQGIF
jgi:hypothetical protein